MLRSLFLIIVISFSIKLVAQTVDKNRGIDSLTQRSYKYLYSNKDSAYFYLSQATKLINSDNWKSGARTLVAWSRSAAYFYDLEMMKQNINSIDSIYSNHQDELDVIENALIYKNSLLIDKGIYSYELTDYVPARNAFSEIIKTTEALPDSLININHIGLLRSAYGFVAKIYNNEGKYDLAKEYYNKNIRWINLKTPNDKKQLFRNYSLLAEVYKNEGNHLRSNEFFIESLRYNLSNEINTNGLVTEAFHIIDNYTNLSKLDSANYYLELMKSNMSEDHSMVNKYHEAKAEIYQKGNKYNKALSEYQIALESLKERTKGTSLEDISLLYNKIGQLHASFNEPKKAVDNFNKGINQLSKKNANKSALLKTLKNKAMVVSAYDLENSNEQVISTVDFGIKTLDSLKPSFKSETDKLLLIEEAFPLFESGLAALYNSYISNPNKELVDKAFYYSEKSKGILLMEALLSAKATNFGTVPDNLIEIEKQLKAQITYLEKEINKSKATSIALEDRLFATKEEYRSLINTIETNYKAYYNLKYNTAVVSLKEVQNNLADDEMLVSYFYGDKHIYIISLTKNTKDFFKIENNKTLEDNTRNIYQMLSDPKSDVSILATETYHLYRLLLQPIIKTLAKEKLIVIADGLLNYIPFGSLNTSSEDINYLIEQKSVSYTNSASLWIQLKENEVYANSVLAFAPNFENDNNSRGKLLPLPHNSEEIRHILTSFDGSSFVNERASLFNFKSQIANYGIVHLATHAIFDDENPEYSYLAFTPDGKQNNLLYVSDLYNLSLHANLVTLSACETGIGDLKRGEGFMSLTRGFFYSGASSIASTLWKVNDASSTQLMNSFYKNLAHGNSKDMALQKSKINFLTANKENALSHPYYWSGFVISGNTEAVVSSNKWIWTVAVGVFLCLVVFLIFRNRK